MTDGVILMIVYIREFRAVMSYKKMKKKTSQISLAYIYIYTYVYKKEIFLSNLYEVFCKKETARQDSSYNNADSSLEI